MRSVSKAFDSFSAAYDEWFDSPDGNILFSMEVDAVRRLVQDSDKPFLEIGVGTGRFAGELGIKFGVDPSGEALKIAARRGVTTVKAEGEYLPFVDGSFGTIFLLFAICFVEGPEQVFSETRRVLKKGGGLIVGMINRKSLWGQLYLEKKAKGHPIYQYARFYSVNEVIKMMENTGYVVESFASTLCQSPTHLLHRESVYEELVEKAGFVGILGKLPQGQPEGQGT